MIQAAHTKPITDCPADNADGEMTLSQAAKIFPCRPHVGTVVRWVRFGVKVGGKGDKGRFVKLHALKSGGRWYVTPQAIAEFRRKISETPGTGKTAVPKSRRSHAPSGYQRAMASLRAQGVI